MKRFACESIQSIWVGLIDSIMTCKNILVPFSLTSEKNLVCCNVLWGSVQSFLLHNPSGFARIVLLASSISHICWKWCTVQSAFVMLYTLAYTIIALSCPLHSHQSVHGFAQEICFAAGSWCLHCYGLDEHWWEELSLGPGRQRTTWCKFCQDNLSTCQVTHDPIIEGFQILGHDVKSSDRKMMRVYQVI